MLFVLFPSIMFNFQPHKSDKLHFYKQNSQITDTKETQNATFNEPHLTISENILMLYFNVIITGNTFTLQKQKENV